MFVILSNTWCKSKANNAATGKKEMRVTKNAGSLWDCEEYIDTSNNQNNPFITVEKDSLKKLSKKQSPGHLSGSGK